MRLEIFNAESIPSSEELLADRVHISETRHKLPKVWRLYPMGFVDENRGKCSQILYNDVRK